MMDDRVEVGSERRRRINDLVWTGSEMKRRIG
jgi:hypothetical protein